MWDRMTKVKLLTWDAAAKVIKVKTGSEVTTLKATSSFFARMLQVAGSSRDDINMEEVIDTHEFSHTNRDTYASREDPPPTNEKSSVIHLLEGLVHNVTASDEASSSKNHSMTTLIADGMDVLQELMAVRNFKRGKDFTSGYVKLMRVWLKNAYLRHFVGV